MNVFEQAVLIWFAAIAVMSSAGAWLAMRAIAAHSRKTSKTALKDMLAHDYYEAVSVIVGAYNAQDTITSSVRSMLGTQHPHFEVIVCDDGSTDRTLEELVEHFSLVEVPKAHDERIATEALVRVMKSVDHANLTVLHKEHGGRADALNAALNLARRPLICVAGADAPIDPQALIRMSRPFVSDERIVAVVSGGSPVARAAWGRLNALTSVQGLTILRRRLVAEAGGWSAASDDPDVDLALRLHRNLRPRRRRHRIVFMPQPSYGTDEAPTSARIRAHAERCRNRGRALWANRRMALRPRYRMVALAIPAQMWSNVVSPFVQAGVWLYVAGSAVAGSFNPAFVGLFTLLTLGVRAIVAELGSTAQATLEGEHTRDEHRSKLAA